MAVSVSWTESSISTVLSGMPETREDQLLFQRWLGRWWLMGLVVSGVP